jgi:hypothetical protein
MLGDVIGIKAEPVIGLDDLQPCGIVIAQRLLVAVEVIENTELHSSCSHGDPQGHSSVTSIHTPPGSAI